MQTVLDSQYYINQTFYFDVHPPLGKMLVGLAGLLTGFNGAFDYPSGATYPEHVPFRAMRVLMALPGVAMVPLAWGTAVELGFSWYARHILTLMVLCGQFVATVPVRGSSGVEHDRRRLAGHFTLCLARLHAALLHFYNRLLLVGLSQSAEVVRAVELFCESDQTPTLHRPFSVDWWAWLVLTGVSIGCVVRCAKLWLASGLLEVPRCTVSNGSACS
jgi:dolichyl-phosphate-mannose-protein mannosyltransferase